MDFGIYLRNQVTYDKMLETALKAEKMGFTGGYLNDHVIGFANKGFDPYLEAWTAMTGIGVQTSKLMVGQIVLFNSLRNPAFLAKSVATLDNMTNGRYTLLIGSGWNEQEYVGYDLMEGGRGMPSVKERVDRFEESVRILNLMLTNESVDYDGKFWKLKGAINLPQPIKKDFPLTIGCKGPRMMRITAENATGLNISTRTKSGIVEAIEQFNKIHEKAMNKGTARTTLDKFEISGFSGIRLARNENEESEMIAELSKQMKISESEIRDEHLVGTPENIISKIRLYQDLGMKMMVVVPQVKDEDPLDFFYDNVMTQL